MDEYFTDNIINLPRLIKDKILWYRKKDLTPILTIRSKGIFPSIVLDKFYWYQQYEKHKNVCIDIRKRYIPYDPIDPSIWAINYNVLLMMSGSMGLRYST